MGLGGDPWNGGNKEQKKSPEAWGPGKGRPVRVVMRRAGGDESEWGSTSQGGGGTAGSRCAGCWETGGEPRAWARGGPSPLAPALTCSGNLFRARPTVLGPSERGSLQVRGGPVRRDPRGPLRQPMCCHQSYPRPQHGRRHSQLGTGTGRCRLALSSSRPEGFSCYLALPRGLATCSRPRPKSLACVKASAHASDVVGPVDGVQPSFARPATAAGQRQGEKDGGSP